MKRLSEKATAVLLSVLLMLPSIAGLTAFAAPEAPIYQMDFEDNTVNAEHPDFTYVAPGKAAYESKDCFGKVVANPKKDTVNSSEKVYQNKIDSTGIGNSSKTRANVDTYTLFSEDKTGKITIELKFLTDELKNEKMIRVVQDAAAPTGAKYLIAFGITGNNSTPARFRYLVPGGANGYINTPGVEENKWYAFKMVIDTDAGTAQWYIDNQLVTPEPISLAGTTTVGSMKVRGLDLYNRTAQTGTANSIYIDDVVVDYYKENRAPVVENEISAKQVTKGQELSIDLSEVFSDPDGDSLIYSCELGEVNDGVYTFTPELLKSYHEKITASDGNGGTVSTEFDIDSLIYAEDFESYEEGVLPDGYTTNIKGSVTDYKPYVGIAEKDGSANKALFNSMIKNATGGSTIYLSNGLNNETYTGLLNFHAKIYTNSEVERGLFLNNKSATSPVAADRLLAIHFVRVDATKSKVNVRVPNSPSNINIDMPNVFVETDTWTDIDITLNTEEATASIKVGDNEPVSYDITQKSGSPLAVGGFSTYNYTKTNGKNTYIYLDDIAFKKINRAPEVASYISGQAVVAGSELVVDLSNVFTDADGDSLMLTAEHGAINGTVYTITPSAEGTITETITADDGLGGTVTTSFVITVEASGSDIIYQTDFETDIVGELPDGYSLNNLGTPIDPTDFRGVTDTILKDSSPNKSLLNQINVIREKGNTNQITYGLKDKNGNYKAYSGLVEFNAQIYNEANEYEKIIYLLNSEKDSVTPPTRVMSLILNNTDSENNKNVVVRIDNHQGGSKSFVLEGVSVPDKTWTNIRIVIDTENRLGQIKIGDFAPVEVSLDLKSETALQLGGFGTYNRYRNSSKGHGSMIAIDDILIRNAVGNAAPVVSGSVEPQSVKVNTPLTLDISQLFSDADGDLLGITADKGTISGGTLTYTPQGTGEDDITLTAIDGKGGKVQYIIRLTVTGNAPPQIAIPVSDQYIVLGEEVSLQLNDTFSDDGQAPVVIAADKGTITGTKFSYTPQAIGEETVTLTATDDEGAVTTLKFRIVINDPTGKDSILFKEDFETTNLGALPTGWRLDLAAGLDQANGFYGANTDPLHSDNQVFYIDNRSTGRGSNSAIAPLQNNHTGDFNASFDMTVTGDPAEAAGNRPTRYVAFCNSSGIAVFAFGYEAGGFRIKGNADSIHTAYSEPAAVLGQTYHIELDYHHAAQRVDLYINGSYVGNFDVARSTAAKNFSMIKLTTYYRAAYGKPNNLFLVDNLLMKADKDISEEDRLTVQKDYEDFRWEYITRESADSVTNPLNLRTEGRYGSSVSWECSNPKVVFSNGFVARPEDGDKLVSLKATFTKGSASMSKSFDMTVKQAIASQYKKQLFKMDFEDQTVGKMPGGWVAPSDYPLHNDTKITVEADPLNASNQVLKQINHHFTPQEYSGFTGRCALPESYNGHIILNVDYMVKQLDTQVMLRIYNDKTELLYSVGNQGAFQYAAQEGTVAVSDIGIQANKWYKFRIEMFTDTGYVLWYIDDQLAACFRCSTNLADNYSLKWVYLYNWVKDGSKDGVAYLDNITVEQNMTTQMANALDLISLDEYKDGVTEDFTLPTNLSEGVQITWKSADSGLIEINGSEATVKRPSAEEIDKTVVLTVTAQIDGKTLTKDFTLLVKRKATAQEGVDGAVERLTFASLSNEPIDAVTRNISLPSDGYEGTAIRWESSDSSVLRIDGKQGTVTLADSDKPVKLTAVLSQNGIEKTKEFDITVKKYFGINLAYGATVLKASSGSQASPAANLNDGNFGTVWNTLNNDASPFVTLDLGVKQRIDSGLISACGNVKDFKLSVSNDGLNYKQVLAQNVSGNAADKTEIQEFSFPAVEARYVKAEFSPVNSQLTSLRELQLFNSALTDDEALRLAKELLKISGSDRIQADIDLPNEATHGTTVTWMSSNPGIITNDGKVTRPAENTDVVLTATILRNGKSVTKDIMVTVLKAGTVMGKDPNKMEKYYGNPTSMTDEMFFGKWEEEYQDWDFDYLPKLNYDYCPELQLVGEYAKKGDYESAKSELVAYYKNKDLNYHITHSSKEYDKAELYANNVMYSSNNSLIGTFTVPAEYSEISVDVSSYVKKSGGKTIYFVQKYKHEPQAEFYTKEAENGAHAPELVIVANGKEMHFKAIKDTYVSPDVNQEKNFGTESRMYAKETKAEDPSTVAGGFGELWTKDTKRPYMQFNITGIDKDTKIDSAVLKMYGKADGGTSDMIVWGEGNNSWKETEFNWRDAMVSVFSWNGSEKVDWIMPKNPNEGADNATYMNIARAIWLGTLTGCYNTTGDEYFAYHAIRQSMDLFEGTKDSVGAFNLQDAGIRAGTEVAAFNSLRRSEYMTDDACMAFIKNMWQLNKTLTLDGYFAPAHNHGVYSNRGQTRITLYFPEFADYEKYKELFINRWDTLSGNLVLSDGSYIEASFNYTNEVINNFLTIIDEAKTFQFPLNAAFNSQLIAVTRYLADCLQPDLTAPAYGDSDMTNYISVMKKVADYFGLEDVKYILSNGAEGEAPDHTSVYYGGGTNKYLNMRDDWSKQGMMLATNYGFGDGKSHTHPDNMAITMFAYGRALLVDPGRYNYSAGTIADWLRRTTEAHNVVNINNTPQSNKHDTLNQFYTNDKFDYANGTSQATATTDGKSFNYKRTILFPKSKFFLVSDRLVPPNEDQNRYDQNWHFLPNSHWTYDKNSAMLETHFESGANLIISQVDKSGFKMIGQSGYYSGKQGTAEIVQFPTFRQEKKGNATFDTVLYPKPAGDTSKVETARIPLDVQTDTATAFTVDIVDGESVQKNIFYQSYEAAYIDRKIGDYRFDGQAMLIERKENGKLGAVSVVNGNKLTVTENGKETVLMQYAPKNSTKLTDLSISYNFDSIELESSVLNLNNISGLTLYGTDEIKSITVNGENVGFTRNGTQLSIDLEAESGEGKIPVTSYTEGKITYYTGTANTAYTSQTSYTYGKSYQASSTIGAGSKLTRPAAWDGTLPKINVAGKSPRTVDGQVKAYLSLDKADVESTIPYEMRIEMPSNLQYDCYQNGKKVTSLQTLKEEGIEAANGALSGNTVGVYQGSGYIVLYSRIPIDVTLYIKNLTPPGNNGGGTGGGGTGPVTPTAPPTTEPTTPPTTEPTTPPTTEPTTGFLDTKGHWAEAAIDEMHKIGVINGVSETEFSPDTDVTRAEFAAMIARLLGLQNADCSFTDVSSDAWYYSVVGVVAQANIMVGANGQFRPNDKITREEMTKVLVEAYAQKQGAVIATEEELAKFTDKDSVSDWATLYMAGAVKLGLISGMTEITIEPQENATRAQAAMMFKRLYDQIRF